MVLLLEKVCLNASFIFGLFIAALVSRIAELGDALALQLEKEEATKSFSREKESEKNAKIEEKQSAEVELEVARKLSEEKDETMRKYEAQLEADLKLKYGVDTQLGNQGENLVGKSENVDNAAPSDSVPLFFLHLIITVSQLIYRRVKIQNMNKLFAMMNISII